VALPGDRRDGRLVAAVLFHHPNAGHPGARLTAKSAWDASGDVHRDAVADAAMAPAGAAAGISAAPVLDDRPGARLESPSGVEHSAAAAVAQHAAEPGTRDVARSAE
jgi:hypothetical protein